MKMWIGETRNLKQGDVITNWSLTDSGAVTLEVNRYDQETVKAVIHRIKALRAENKFLLIETVFARVSEEFGIEEDD